MFLCIIFINDFNYFRWFLRTKVSAGSGQKDGIEEIYAGKWFVHPKNERGLDYDIALIRLKVPFTKHRMDGKHHYSINAICLPNKNDGLISYLTNATFFGFGRINDNWIFHLSDKLQKSEHSFFSYCRERDICSQHRWGCFPALSGDHSLQFLIIYDI